MTNDEHEQLIVDLLVFTEFFLDSIQRSADLSPWATDVNTIRARIKALREVRGMAPSMDMSIVRE